MVKTIDDAVRSKSGTNGFNGLEKSTIASEQLREISKNKKKRKRKQKSKPKKLADMISLTNSQFPDLIQFDDNEVPVNLNLNHSNSSSSCGDVSTDALDTTVIDLEMDPETQQSANESHNSQSIKIAAKHTYSWLSGFHHESTAQQVVSFVPKILAVKECDRIFMSLKSSRRTYTDFEHIRLPVELRSSDVKDAFQANKWPKDRAEGHVGTVCEIGRFGSLYSPDKMVVVNWEAGHRTNYRVGYQGQNVLTIVDAQVGVKYPNIKCDGCSKAGVAGIRFRCAQRRNYDLCATCNDMYDSDHQFIRYQKTNSVGVRVAIRQGPFKIQLKGIFVGAKVVRGPDWEWGQQDSGEGKTGRVMEISGWDNESCRSVANVSWVTGSTNVLCNVDLKYIQATLGGYCYRDHMPVLGKTERQKSVVQAITTYSVGDKVKIRVNKKTFMKLQRGHGGWNPQITEYFSKIGTVHGISDKGDILVQFEGCLNRWTFHSSALIKIYVYTFHVGDLVTIINDAAKVKKLQRDHGEWIELMRKALNKSAKVIRVYNDGDLHVREIEAGFDWILNPNCVKLERSQITLPESPQMLNRRLKRKRSHHKMKTVTLVDLAN